MTKYTPEQRIAIFWSRVDRSGGADACWIWTGGCDGKGYGNMLWCGKMRGAHRISYELSIGLPPDDLDVLHTCDNPQCVNPHHLFLGTHQDNMADRERKGRNNPPRGVKQWLCKITDAQVVEIQQRYANGETNKAELAREFLVHTSTIWKIIHRKSHCHVNN